MRIQLKLFASLREAVQTSTESLDLPIEVRTTEQLRVWLSQRGGDWEQAFAPSRVLRVAIDQQMVEGDVTISSGQEVAFFPPVTGG